MDPLYSVSLTAHQWQLVLNVLGTAAYRDVAELIAAIVTQTNSQTNTNRVDQAGDAATIPIRSNSEDH
jgi:hypothetical protein